MLFRSVRGLEIAVDDAVHVGVVDRAGDVAQERQLVADRDAPAPVLHLEPLDVLHREEALAFNDAGLVDADDVRVLGEVGGDLGLAEELTRWLTETARAAPLLQPRRRAKKPLAFLGIAAALALLAAAVAALEIGRASCRERV